MRTGVVFNPWLRPYSSNQLYHCMKFIAGWRVVLFGCVTIGLAPFFPEPHVWGKLTWIAGGAVGMQPVDWLDALFHGLPWLLLLFNIGIMIGKKFKSTSVKSIR